MAPRRKNTTEREGEDFISETQGQFSCKEGRREISKQPEITGSTEQGRGIDKETKAEAEDKEGEARAGAEVGTGAEAGDKAGEGLERGSATMFSRPGMWTKEQVNLAR